MDKLKRLENESNFEYKVRLCNMKLNKEIDLDWCEIVELLGLGISSDHLRKLSYAYKEYNEYIDNKQINSIQDDELLNELELKKRELYKERVRFQDQKREYNNLIRNEARKEHIKDEIRKLVDNINNIRPLKVTEYPKINGEKEALLVLSDWHVGICISNYFNEFNIDVLNKRVEKIISKTIHYGKYHNVKKLHVAICGDMINGLIHVTSRISNTENTIEQTQRVSEILADMISKFATHFEEVIVLNTNGNHDRVIANKSDSIDDESYSYIIPWYMKARTINIKNIKYIENKYDKGIAIGEICGHKALFVHGDKDKPSNVVQNLSLMTRDFYSVICMGHIHHNYEDDKFGTEIIVNGSLSGVDEYAKNLRLISTPMQKLMIFNKEDGRECTYNIKLN